MISRLRTVGGSMKPKSGWQGRETGPPRSSRSCTRSMSFGVLDLPNRQMAWGCSPKVPAPRRARSRFGDPTDGEAVLEHHGTHAVPLSTGSPIQAHRGRLAVRCADRLRTTSSASTPDSVAGTLASPEGHWTVGTFLAHSWWVYAQGTLSADRKGWAAQARRTSLGVRFATAPDLSLTGGLTRPRAPPRLRR